MTTLSLPRKGIHVFGYGYGLLGFTARVNAALAMLAAETDGMAIDFTSQAMAIKDVATPANVFAGNAFGKLVYTSPAAKWTRRASGLYQQYTAGSDLPYEWGTDGALRGVVVESQRTNLCLRSQQFDNASWVKSNATVTADQDTAPDGTLTADLITPTTAAGLVYQTISLAGGSATHTFSVWLRSATGSPVTIPWFANGGGVSPNPTTGNWNVTTTWQRFTATVVAAAGAANGNFGFGDIAAGTSWTVGQNAYAWQAQVELGVHASSMIPTTTATVTRGADNISLATTAFPFSTTNGTLFFDGYASDGLPASVNQNAVSLATDASNRIVLRRSAALRIDASVRSGGTVTFASNPASPAINNSARVKAAIAYNATDTIACRNGTLDGAPDTAVTAPSPTSFRVGSEINDSHWDGTISKILFVPRRFSGAELQTLTTI